MAEHDTEPALVYDAGERRTHDQHAAEAYAFAERADRMVALADSTPTLTVYDVERRDRYDRIAGRADMRSQWHATMAVYASLMPAPEPAHVTRASAFSEDERAVIVHALEPFSSMLISSPGFKEAVTALLEEFRA